tara:strand:+ start:419 stop:1033 length:615 start_codon:yes stop_codon:yes gene_type:complete
MNSGDFRLIVGLGNPGHKYHDNRHNIGFMALDKYAENKGVEFKEKTKLHGFLATANVMGKSIKLLKPNTFMNESGRSIRSTLDWYDLRINQLIVLVDDMDLPLGKLRIREKGSSGGHNGLKSTIQYLGTQNFCRLRIGIGSPSQNPQERKSKTISHVLGDFSIKEHRLMSGVLDEVLTALDVLNKLDFEKVCTTLNSYQLSESE